MSGQGNQHIVYKMQCNITADPLPYFTCVSLMRLRCCECWVYKQWHEVGTRPGITHLIFIFCSRCNVKFRKNTENFCLCEWWQKSDEWMRACMFKAEWVLTMPIKTIGPHHQQSICSMLDTPHLFLIAIKQASCVRYRHQHMGESLPLLVNGRSTFNIHRLLCYKSR